MIVEFFICYIATPPSSLTLTYLNPSSRRDLIKQCRILRTELAKQSDSNSQYTQTLISDYAKKKQLVRESAAMHIQARWRGYKVTMKYKFIDFRFLYCNNIELHNNCSMNLNFYYFIFCSGT
jgi:hypothetical protein